MIYLSDTSTVNPLSFSNKISTILYLRLEDPSTDNMPLDNALGAFNVV